MSCTILWLGALCTQTNPDWVSYKNEELGVSFVYPELPGSVTAFTSDCTDTTCSVGKIIGWEYNSNEALPRSYILAAAVTDDFSADRDTWPTDYSNFEEINGEFYLNGVQKIPVEKNGEVKGLKYIIYKLDKVSLMADNLPHAYVGMIQLPTNNEFKVLTIYFENPTSLQQVIESVESVDQNNLH